MAVSISNKKDMNVVEARDRHSYLNDEVIQGMVKKEFSTKGNSNRVYVLYNLN